MNDNREINTVYDTLYNSEEEAIIIRVYYPDGKIETVEYLTEFTYKDIDYLVFSKKDDDGIYIVRLIDSDEDDYKIEEIEDDDEFDSVYEYYNSPEFLQD